MVETIEKATLLERVQSAYEQLTTLLASLSALERWFDWCSQSAFNKLVLPQFFMREWCGFFPIWLSCERIPPYQGTGSAETLLSEEKLFVISQHPHRSDYSKRNSLGSGIRTSGIFFESLILIYRRQKHGSFL